jgi:hypothetical protein
MRVTTTCREKGEVTIIEHKKEKNLRKSKNILSSSTTAFQTDKMQV